MHPDKFVLIAPGLAELSHISPAALRFVTPKACHRCPRYRRKITYKLATYIAKDAGERRLTA